MTYLATWPGSNAAPAGCDAFETEAAALVKAREMTAKGAPHCVVYWVSDEQIERTA